MARVLVVDDKTENLYLLEVLLKGYGHEVQTACNGAEALEITSQVLPDIIVSDILMPVMDGFALCRTWKTEQRTREIPFIFYTATYTEQKDEIFALKLGADLYISKPVEPEILVEKINQVLDAHTNQILKPASPVSPEEKVFLKEYNETLIRKLEDKMEQVEAANRELVQRRKLLEKSLAEKEALLREVHHRVKNNLQVMSSLLNLQREQLQDPDGKEALLECQGRIQSMSLVHESLYESASLSEVDFDVYLTNLLRHLLGTYSGKTYVQLETQFEPVKLSIDQAIPCGLIINELVSNALKHAFKGRSSGKLHIKLEQLDGKAAIHVEDNGIGFPESLDFNHAKSLGLSLVKMLSRQLGGIVELNRGSGASFQLIFPIQALAA